MDAVCLLPEHNLEDHLRGHRGDPQQQGRQDGLGTQDTQAQGEEIGTDVPGYAGRNKEVPPGGQGQQFDVLPFSDADIKDLLAQGAGRQP
ncbi:Uncharacterised protein [Sphingobacterium daejeonense]|nr:Uncharacterised protein [Sphingobacterium daejeonense]